ncbi:MAG: DegT/DnrJ/EryC1/StrS family aminotransferase [Chitinispirillaceae bacterium]
MGSKAGGEVLVPFLDWSSHHAEFREKWLEDVRRIYDSGVFLRGPHVAEFERRFAAYCSSAPKKLFATAVANGLDALFLSLKALEFRPGSEILIPGNTFIATALAVKNAGYNPVLVPPDVNTYNMDPNRLDDFLSERTCAVIPVHLYGRICSMPQIAAWAQKSNVAVIEDAAQAHGARLNGQMAGSFGLAAAFSFYPGKNLGALGDAGAVLTADAAFGEKIRRLGNYGSEKKYEHELQGQNSRMDEIQAAFLVHKLALLQKQLEHRRWIARVYSEQLPDELRLPPRDDDQYSSAWHLYVVRHPQRDRLLDFLDSRGVRCSIHYPRSIDLHQTFENCNLNRCPVSRQLSREVLSLPIGPHIEAPQLEYIVKQVRAFFGK